jgi:ATP-dependent HslUV protease ATP-binding subunit HslU
MKSNLTPKKIVEELNKYIVSQDDAKRSVAVSLRNRFRRKEIGNEQLRQEIIPKNIILIGATGVGKTEIARRLAKISNSPFIKVEATKYTEVGYVGKDVETMVKDLVSITFNMVKEEKIEVMKESFMEKVYDIVATKISPLYKINDDEKFKVLNSLKNKEYDETEIEIEIKSNGVPSPVIEVYSNGNQGEEAGNIQEIIGELMGSFGIDKKNKIRKMKVKDAINYILKEEIEDNFDKEAIIPEVIERVEQDGIIFIDEIDKIAEREGSSRGEVSRQGVQRDILPIVEGTTIMTKLGPVKTDHILFIAAGAFSMSKPSDLMPELQGRFPVKVNLKSLNKVDFVKILTEIDNNLIVQYEELLKVDGLNIKIDESAIDKIAEYAIKLNEKVENIGARRLATILEEVLSEYMFDAPYATKKKKVILTGEDVEKKMSHKIKKENLNDYIL